MTVFPNFCFFCAVAATTTDPLDCQTITGACKGGKHFLDRVRLKFRGLIDHKPALSPAYLLFSVSSLHKCDLYPSSERGGPWRRERTQSVFSASEIHWKAPNCQAWKSSLVKLKTYWKRNYSAPCTTLTLGRNSYCLRKSQQAQWIPGSLDCCRLKFRRRNNWCDTGQKGGLSRGPVPLQIHNFRGPCGQHQCGKPRETKCLPRSLGKLMHVINH